MKKIIIVILSVFTLTAMVSYCAVFYHAHSIENYCPYGSSHVVTCTPPGYTFEEHGGSNEKMYQPWWPQPEPWDDDICQGYLASDSEICAFHAENGQ